MDFWNTNTGLFLPYQTVWFSFSSIIALKNKVTLLVSKPLNWSYISSVVFFNQPQLKKSIVFSLFKNRKNSHGASVSVTYQER